MTTPHTLQRLFAIASMVIVQLGLVVSGAQADQPRDWMIGPATEGGKINVDMLYPGLQVGYEHTIPIYGQANSLTLRGSSLLTAAFNDVRADAELRIVLITLGASVGYRDNWRTHIYRADQPVDRAARRTTDNTAGFEGELFNHGREDWGYIEARIGLALPFNDHLVYSGTTAFLFEDREPRSLDWRNGVVRSADMLVRSEHFLLGHHRKFGGFGPLFQILNYELGSTRTTQLNYGFMFVGRPGFTRDNDLVLFQMLFHFGDSLGGDDNRQYWGAHNIYSSSTTLVSDKGLKFGNSRVPLSFLIAYRMVFNL